MTMRGLKQQSSAKRLQPALALMALLILSGCMVGPDYKRPNAAGITAAFKEAPPGWTVAQPQDTAPKGTWWSIYHDPLLDRLESQVAVSNQNVKQFEAQYREAQATVDVARSALFPTLGATAGVTRSSSGSSSSAGSVVGTTGTTGATGTTGVSSSGSRTRTTYSIQGNFDWDLDVWGRIRRQIESDVAATQVSAADLVNATLVAQVTLATDYFELRYQDALGKLLTDTVAAYENALRITQNQYNAGTANPSDVAARRRPSSIPRGRSWSTSACCVRSMSMRSPYSPASHHRSSASIQRGMLADQRAGRAGRGAGRRCCSAGRTSPRPSAR